MKSDATRHIRWYLCMAVSLLCLVACHVDAAAEGTLLQVVEDAVPLQVVHDAPCASLCEKENDMLHAVREMGWWGIPSASILLQGTAGRMLTLNEALQRMGKMSGSLFFDEPSCPVGLAEVLCQTLSSKRFYSGYYIYYRCQMRC